MDHYVAALKRSCSRDGVVRYAVTRVNNQRELFASITVLAAVDYRGGEGVIACREERKAIARTVHLDGGLALQRGRDRVRSAGELQGGQRIALDDEVRQYVIVRCSVYVNYLALGRSSRVVAGVETKVAVTACWIVDPAAASGELTAIHVEVQACSLCIWSIVEQV